MGSASTATDPAAPLPDRFDLVRAWVVPRFQVALDAVPCAMILTDADGTIVLVNRETQAVFGLEATALLRQKTTRLVPPRLRQQHAEVRHSLLSDPGDMGEFRDRPTFALRGNGSEFPVVVGMNLIESPLGTLLLTSVQDATEQVSQHDRIRGLHAEMQERVRIRTARLKRANELLRREVEQRQAVAEQLRAAQGTLERANRELQALAMVDPLTNLHNRRHFDQCLDHEWRRAQRNRRPLSLVLFDVDRFKAYNDAAGHPAGDACLQAVAQSLRQSVRRPADVVARFGGEEFAMLLPETGRDGALTVAETARARVEALALPHPAGGLVTVSAGVCCRSLRFVADVATFLEYCDRALYRAKAAGRNSVRAAPKSAGRAAGGAPATDEAEEGANGQAGGADDRGE